jgi:Matrixin/Protein of unknown function (DUF2510)
VGKRDDSGAERPRAPGWYPDPWSATGEGQRYFDGERWGTNEKPLGRHTTVAVEPIPFRRRSRWRRRSRKRSGTLSERLRNGWPFIALAVLIAIVYAIPRLRGSHHGKTATSAPTTATTLPADHPPEPRTEALKPLGTPAPVPAGTGSYEVERHQPNSPNTPVAWDPCRPIHYVVNPAGAPPDGALLLQSAIARLHTATGLQFVDDGTTTERPDKDRNAYQPARYDRSRWAPVLIAWSDEVAYPDLAGYIAGETEPLAVTPNANGGNYVYVSGEITFDRRDLSAAKAPDRAVVRAVMLHELGHLVGLDHTSDRHQIMFSESQYNVVDYGVGDLRGLARLGTQACYPNV